MLERAKMYHQQFETAERYIYAYHPADDDGRFR
jgi:hypothetical protein